MGGERETTVCQSKATSKKATLGDIRVHESNSEVHFHADSSKLKVAVPTGIWFQAWMRLMDQGGTFSFIDSERGTRVMVDIPTIDDDVIDAKVSISKIEMGDTFKALHEFTTRK